MTLLDTALLALGVALAAAFWALLGARVRGTRQLFFALLLLNAVLALTAGLGTLVQNQNQAGLLPLGLPWLPWHLRLDPLAGFMLCLIGTVTAAVALYGPGYTREFRADRSALAHLGLFTGLFLLGMELVVLADDAFLFMIAWELMSLSSYFLVAFQHEHPANRRAGFLYLLLAHLGGLAILLSFAVLAANGGDFSFDAMRAAHPDLTWGSIAFGLALLGFGMKAGLLPLHVWLPEAHPVAPSHVSALMSGVMLKVAVYGFVRTSFDLIGNLHWSWGLVTLVIGSISALMGVLYALMQHDLKRLLAYHSIENIGIIVIGLGLAILFYASHHPLAGALALIAALLHTFNHALFKGLLFLGAGAILHATHERDMEHMGGLIRRMPQTALLFLTGCIAISALPPFNGFVSEWLTFQAALRSNVLESGTLSALIPVSAAMLALTGALAAACFVKVYGVVFLGLPRSRHVRHAHEVDGGMRAGMLLLALLCLAVGVLPTAFVALLDTLVHSLMGGGLAGLHDSDWLWLTPMAPRTANYSALFVALGLLLAWGIGYLLLHRRDGLAVRHAPPWDCGFGALNPRMQYSATAFAMPIRRIFQPLWEVREQVTEERDPAQPWRLTGLRYHLHTDDRAWALLYQPVTRWLQAAARRVTLLQTGRIRIYLAYSFATLIFLLWVVS